MNRVWTLFRRAPVNSQFQGVYAQARRYQIALIVALFMVLALLCLSHTYVSAVDEPEPIPVSGTLIEPFQFRIQTDEQGRTRPYLIDGELRIAAVVKVEPGVELIFKRGASINVVKDGSLSMLAHRSEPVVFRGLVRVPGWWDGIVTQWDSQEHGLSLDNCEISDATTAISTENEAPIIENCTLHHNETGLAMTAFGAGEQRLENIVVSDNVGFALRYFMTQNALTSGIDMKPPFENLVVENNGHNAVQIDGLLTAFTWQIPSQSAHLTLASPKLADGSRLPLNLSGMSLGEGQILEIEPGTTLHLQGLWVNDGGSLIAEGKPAELIRFLPRLDPPADNWNGITLAAGGSVDLMHCEISEVGAPPGLTPSPALTVGTDATITKCKIYDNDGIGLYLSEAGISPILNALEIINNVGEAIVQKTADMQPRLQDLTVAGNGRDALMLGTGDITRNVALDSMVTSNGTPLPIIGGLSVQDGGYLRILSGTEIFMASDERLTVSAGGVISATDFLVTGELQQPGSWRGVDLKAGATALLEGCEIAFGGIPDALNGVVTIQSSDVVLRDCVIRDGAHHGIQLMGDGLTPELEELLLENNAGAAVSEWNKKDDTMDPTYRGLLARGNGWDGIELDVRAFYADRTLEQPGSTGDGPLPFLVPELLNVAPNARLSILDGTLLQFLDIRNWGYLSVSGRLEAEGATFVGRSQTPGSWAGIRVLAGGSADLGGCAILYAGDDTNNSRWRGSALRIESTESVSLRGCTIHSSAGLAVDVAGGSRVDMRGNNIYDNFAGLSAPAAGRGTISSATAAPDDVGPNAQFATAVDARNSWWGHASGPRHSSVNPTGQGSNVTGSVLLTPWAESPVTDVLPERSIYLPLITR